MRYSRIGLWVAAAAVAVGVTTTVVATATGADGREVLSRDGVVDALSAAREHAAAAPMSRDDATAASTYRAGDEKLLQTTGGDIVARCEEDVLAIESIAPKRGYQLTLAAIDRGGKVLRPATKIRSPGEGAFWITVGDNGDITFVFDRASSEVSYKVTVKCVDGDPMAEESEIVKNYGAGKG